MEQRSVEQIMNTTVLAYMGDAVYEVRIRKMLVEQGVNAVDKLHRAAVKYVSAEGQAKAVRAMLDSGFLNDAEERLVKRARNHRSMSRPRNADPREYKLATGLEALLGQLFLDGKHERMIAVVDEAVRIINEN